MIILNPRSEKNLIGVHEDLVTVVREVANTTETSFVIVEGLRTLERQKELVAAGASQTLNSRHITGHAIDFAIFLGKEYRQDWPLYVKHANEFKEAAKRLGIPIICGADWKFADGPHIELDRKYYP